MTPKEQFDAALASAREAVAHLAAPTKALFPPGTRIKAVTASRGPVTGTVQQVFIPTRCGGLKIGRPDFPTLVVLPDGDQFPRFVAVDNDTLQIL